ncbi:MAG: UbiD family decarboxylase [Candidatus Sungbacteria bacterium]|nr:UbiD family decarboxylase [Candidatus Sungbacteria bacterium]
MAYRDIREYLKTLENKGKLRRVKKEVDKDWEIAAVCRQLFYKFLPENRPALLFERVKDFSIPVLAGSAAASPEIYKIGLEAKTWQEIDKRWFSALERPIPPRMIQKAPCKENILLGDKIDITAFPIPIWTPGQDAAPYITAPLVITKDRASGIRNIGTHRMMIKNANTTGMHIGTVQDAARHIKQYEDLGLPAPLAVAIGTDPTLCYVSTTRSAEHIDEFALAGGLRNEPVELIQCETVPLEVPATAEIILEGEIIPGTLELEGPFGEFTGYMSPQGMRRVFRIKCITHRNNPIYHAFISQKPPSESSCIRKIGNERIIMHHLRDILNLPVSGVNLKESGGSEAIAVISLQKQYEGQVKQLIHGLWSLKGGVAKLVIVVDEDVDVQNDFEVELAISFRMQPHKDVYIERGERAIVYDPSLAPENASQLDPRRSIGSRMVIDATKKHAFPEPSLPPLDHLNLVHSRWKEYGID